MTNEVREPRDCPRYDRCNATLCPLDRAWHKRAVLPTEEFCPYLRELDKPGDVRARFVGRYDAFVIDAAIALREAISRNPHPRYAFVERQIERAADSPNMIDKGKAVRDRFKKAQRTDAGNEQESGTAVPGTSDDGGEEIDALPGVT